MEKCYSRISHNGARHDTACQRHTCACHVPRQEWRIAFVVGPDIYTMNPDGSDVKQLTNLGPDDGSFWESWSPDGKLIVFNVYRSPAFLGELWLMNPDGSNQRLVLDDTDFDDEIPSFTPDGTSVVFTRCRLDIEACALFQIKKSAGAASGRLPTSI